MRWRKQPAVYLDAHPAVAAQIQQTGRLRVMLSVPSGILEKQAHGHPEHTGYRNHRASIRPAKTPQTILSVL